jgi:Leucine-rich repeat (LRR) protein
MPTPPPAPVHHLLLVLPLFLAVVLANAATSQEDTLLAWKSSLGDPPALSTWTNATAACAGWRGVTCDTSGRVTSLRLRGLVLAGTLDALDAAALPTLAELDLNGNSLEGTIPAGLSRLRALATLDLGSNALNGSIPPQLGDLSGLVELRLYHNNLAGAIPHQLSRLPRIVHFDLGSNYLTNPDYARFSAMPTVRFLSLYLNGSFPDFVHGCGNVTYLDLSQNGALSGPVPDELAERLPNLRYLNLSNNAFSGRIPASLARLKDLQDLRFGANKFTGGVPEFLGSMSQLRILELGGCPLGGRLPPVLGQLQKLQRLDVSNAGLVSTLPMELRKLGSLDFMDLSANQLSGSLPASFAGMRKMREFGISSNNLTGEIPGRLFASWPELISFQVQYNSLTARFHRRSAK